jgi:hypothetical protein
MVVYFLECTQDILTLPQRRIRDMKLLQSHFRYGTLNQSLQILTAIKVGIIIQINGCQHVGFYLYFDVRMYVRTSQFKCDPLHSLTGTKESFHSKLWRQ